MRHKFLVTGILLLSLVVSSLVPSAVLFAQTETEGAGENASDSATTDELRKRIERVVEERREQIKGVVEDLLVKKGAYIGEITRISEEAITIKSNETTNIIPLTEEVVILENNSPVNIANIEVGNWATVLGNRTSTTIEPEYVLISATSLRPITYFVRLGNVVSLDRTELVFTPRGTEDEITVALQRNSKYQSSDGEKAVAADFEEELGVLVIAAEGQDGLELITLRSLAPFADAEEQ
ncbi:MAG: hypothetical protein QG639_539 [Patescibacteria group bacterium]|nr:hypothetical protein [Patescibacteria group bacterium]